MRFLHVLMLTVFIFAGCGGGNGIVDGELDGVIMTSTWRVGTRIIEFSKVVGSIAPGSDNLVVKFDSLRKLDEQLARVGIGNISTVQPGVNVATDFVRLSVDLSHDWFLSDDSSPCSIRFTRLDLTDHGRIEGFISGTLLSDQENNGTEETYILFVSFTGVFNGE